MAQAEPVWDDFVFTYITDDDGVHIKHRSCGKEVGIPEYWMKASTAKRAIEEHASQCGREEEK